VTSITYSDSTPGVTYVYDNAAITFGKGRLYSVSNANSVTRYTAYDALGRVKTMEQLTGDHTYSSSYTYQRQDGLATQVLPSGRTLTYS
jgi:YD repeat-containing protein